LIGLSQGGDLEAFNRLVTTYQDAVFSVTLRMVRNRASAEDLAQETFVSAWRAIRSYRGGNPGSEHSGHSFRAWLLKIARNATYDHLRKVGRHGEVSIDDDAVTFAETVPSKQRGPEEWALTGELGRTINEGLGLLPSDQRMAITLIDIEGYSYEEAAEVMETNIGTVKSRVNRGRTKLRDFLRTKPELLPASFRLKDNEVRTT
jgi:RNA polymerase sigma-70 factor, ECF subfamily